MEDQSDIVDKLKLNHLKMNRDPWIHLGGAQKIAHKNSNYSNYSNKTNTENSILSYGSLLENVTQSDPYSRSHSFTIISIHAIWTLKFSQGLYSVSRRGVEHIYIELG